MKITCPLVARDSKWMFARLLLLFVIGSFRATDASSGWGEHPLDSELDATSAVSITFATSDLRAPASVFGHTYLVFHGSDGPLPDSPVVEFTGDAHSLADHWNALSNDVSGRYRLSYWSYKQRDYAVEGRSLWIYPLVLTETERYQLVKNIKVRLGKEYRYTFSRHNCAHHILAPIAESIGWARSSPEVPYVTPLSTLRMLSKEGRLGPPLFVGSPRFFGEQAIGALESDDRDQVATILAGPTDPSYIPNRAVQNAVSLASSDRVLREGRREERDRLFRLRATMPSAQLLDPPNDPLEEREGSAVGLLIDPKRGGLFLTYRAGFGGVDSNPQRYAGFSSIEYLSARVLVHDNVIKVTNLTFFSLESNRPRTLLTEGFTQLLRVRYIDDSAWLGRPLRQLELSFARGLSIGGDSAVLSVSPLISLRMRNQNAVTDFEVPIGARTVLAGRGPSELKWKASHEREITKTSGITQRVEFEAYLDLTKRSGISLFSAHFNGDAKGITGLRWWLFG